MKKYSETVIRHQAVDQDGKSREILERITYEREVLAGGALGDAVEASRRYDLKTGERVNRLNDTEFADDDNELTLRLKS